MIASSIAVNSTNVRSQTRLAWERLNLAVSTVLAPERAVDRAARLFATPPRFAHTSPERDLLATGRGFVVDSTEGRVAAWRFGEGDRPAVILMHGWGGRGAQLRAFVPALVEAGYQAILFDHTGHGHSEGREASLVHFMKGLDAVARNVEAGGVKVAGIVAHSLGAAAATAWLNHTRREMRVVLIAAPTSLERYSGYFARRLGMAESIRRPCSSAWSVVSAIAGTSSSCRSRAPGRTPMRSSSTIATIAMFRPRAALRSRARGMARAS